MPGFGGGRVTDYVPPPALPYTPGGRALADDVTARGYPQTIASVRATNSADKANATKIPACASFSVAPSASPIANGTRPVVPGSFPVIAYILDESNAEIAPPLIITGPQIVRFGAQAHGVRLESSSISTGSDWAYDVTVDPNPLGEWTIPGAENIVPGSLVAGTSASGDISTPVVTPVTLPVGTRALAFIGECTTYANATVLLGAIDLPRPQNAAWLRWGFKVCSAGTGAMDAGIVAAGSGDLGTGASVGASPDATLGNKTVTLSTQRLTVPGGYLPRSTRVVWYDQGSGNRWKIDVVAY